MTVKFILFQFQYPQMLKFLFHTIFTSAYIMLVFYVSKSRYCRHWKTWWNMFACFCCRWIFRILLHPSTFSIIHSRSEQIINGVLSDFWYWLNSNILVSSEGIITLQKFLFSHTFLCDSSLFFFSKGMKTIQTIKIAIIFWCYSS